MAVSGVTSWDPTRNEIIADALFNVGAAGPDGDIRTEYMQLATRRLNSLVKSLQTEGMNRWLGTDGTYTMTASEEVTGSDGNVYTCRKSHTSAATNKPVTGANWTTYWHKAGSTGGVWANATAYNSIADFNLGTDVISVSGAFYRDTNSVDYPIELIPYNRFLELGSKYYTGTPVQIAIDWTLTPTVYMNPVPDNTRYVIHLRETREINDFTAAANTADFSKLWNNVLMWGLTEQLSHGFGKELNERQIFKSRFDEALMKAKGFDGMEDGVVTIAPAFGPTASYRGQDGIYTYT